jgi:hypothetical protein
MAAPVHNVSGVIGPPLARVATVLPPIPDNTLLAAHAATLLAGESLTASPTSPYRPCSTASAPAPNSAKESPVPVRKPHPLVPV